MDKANYNSQKPIGEEINGNEPFYLVIRLGSNGYQQADASPTMRYSNPAEAAEEAKRLAAKHPNHPRGFAVVQAVAIYKASVAIERKLLTAKDHSMAEAYHAKHSININPYGEF
jgi:hypothetical protein